MTFERLPSCRTDHTCHNLSACRARVLPGFGLFGDGRRSRRSCHSLWMSRSYEPSQDMRDVKSHAAIVQLIYAINTFARTQAPIVETDPVALDPVSIELVELFLACRELEVFEFASPTDSARGSMWDDGAQLARMAVAWPRLRELALRDYSCSVAGLRPLAMNSKSLQVFTLYITPSATEPLPLRTLLSTQNIVLRFAGLIDPLSPRQTATLVFSL